jgi:hypothetical protein
VIRIDPITYTVLRLGQPPATVRLYPLRELAHLMEAEPLHAATLLARLEPGVLRVQARAYARWQRWYGGRGPGTAHSWWRGVLGPEHEA